MKKGLSQETLKLIACITMLLDHIGAVFFRGIGLRLVGRIAFPIFCFLVAEGAHYTHSKRKYLFRMFIGAALSELPFDFGLFGGVTMRYQSVMLTLMLGLLAVFTMEKLPRMWLKPFAVIPYYLIADYLCTDYGGNGVLLVAMFAFCRELPNKRLWQTVGAALCCWCIGGYRVTLFGLRFPLEMFGLLAMIPIWLYNGRKLSHSRAIQWAFYLFYPVHLTVIALIRFLR